MRFLEKGGGVNPALRIAALIVAGGAAQAQDANINCLDPVTQFEMNQCAHEGWLRADADLNRAYTVAIARAQSLDAAIAEGGRAREITTEEMLRRAQRSWIAFRDQACSVESDIAFGGSMQPLLYSSCLEDVTLQRTEQLRFFAEVN